MVPHEVWMAHAKETAGHLTHYLAKMFLWFIATIVVPAIFALVWLNYDTLKSIHESEVEDSKQILLIQEDSKKRFEYSVAQFDLLHTQLRDRLDRLERQVDQLGMALINENKQIEKRIKP